MAKRFDLTKFRTPVKNYLTEDEKKEVVTIKKTPSKSLPKEKKVGKVGRPTIEKSPLNSPLTINFTEEEYNKIKEKAGLAPMTGYLREIIKNSGII